MSNEKLNYENKNNHSCSYLKDDMQICGAKSGNPCGRHNTEKQIRQEMALKEMMVSAFNKTNGTEYLVSTFGLDDKTSAFDFLCAGLSYISLDSAKHIHQSPAGNFDQMGHAWSSDLMAYLHIPVSSDFPPAHINAGQSYCQVCEVDLEGIYDMKVDENLIGISDDPGPQTVNHILSHPKVKTEYDKIHRMHVPAEPECEHVWVLKYEDKAKTKVIGKRCNLCDRPFSMNVRDDR